MTQHQGANDITHETQPPKKPAQHTDTSSYSPARSQTHDREWELASKNKTDTPFASPFLTLWMILAAISAFLRPLQGTVGLAAEVIIYLLLFVAISAGAGAFVLWRALEQDEAIDAYTWLMSALIGQGLRIQQTHGWREASSIPVPTASPQNFKTRVHEVSKRLKFVTGKDDADPGRTPLQLLFIRAVRQFSPMDDVCLTWPRAADAENYYANKIAPYVSRNVDWDQAPGKASSDRALELLCFSGMGGHLLSKSSEDPDLVEISLNYMRDYEVRDSFDRYGADAVFQKETQKLLRIKVGEDVYTPESDHWEWAKAVFKTSLNVRVVVGSHFVQTHMMWAQIATLAMRSTLNPDHVLRRFLTPFTYRTFAINNSAIETLISEKGMVHRVSAFTWQGLQDFVLQHQTSPRMPKAQRFESACKELGVDRDNISDFPWRDDKLLYVESIRNMVDRYVTTHWPTDQAINGDTELNLFWQKLIDYGHDWATGFGELSIENLKLLLETAIVAVTGEHEDYGGRTPSYFSRSELVSAKIWKDKKLNMQDKRTTSGFIMITMITALRMPRLTGNLEHLFYDFNSKEIMTDWQLDLIKVSDEIRKRNKTREIKCNIFDPRTLETSVSI